jgi:hypothetical protein
VTASATIGRSGLDGQAGVPGRAASLEIGESEVCARRVGLDLHLFQHRYFDPKGLVSVGRPFLAVYDLEQAVHELCAGGFPDLDELLKESLLEPVHPDEVSEFFGRHALDGH